MLKNRGRTADHFTLSVLEFLWPLSDAPARLLPWTWQPNVCPNAGRTSTNIAIRTRKLSWYVTSHYVNKPTHSMEHTVQKLTVTQPRNSPPFIKPKYSLPSTQEPASGP